MSEWLVVEGDCCEVLRLQEEASIDSIVTDPPYGLKFMGKDFDNLGDAAQQREWHRLWAVEALRVLKPGGHLLAFGGTRTYHHLASALEEAGFEIRDQMQWIYSSGFPKSLDVSKAIDKAAGAKREVIGTSRGVKVDDNKGYGGIGRGAVGIKQEAADIPITAPATEDAKRWEGWGTALKPAHEPIVVARKPLKGTVAKNFIEHGVGGMNIDACRVEFEEGEENPSIRRYASTEQTGNNGWKHQNRGGQFDATTKASMEKGRWPANVIFDEEAGVLLDDQHENASRFFYCPKPNKKEKEKGLTELRANDRFRTRQCTECGKNVPSKGSCGCDADIEWVQPKDTMNTHPTVKPIKLMRYLCRLVTPPGGTVLDPFTGSGTTGAAAVLEGFDFLGIELDPEQEGYVDLANQRIAYWENAEV